MIITLKNADFSLSNIGTLNTWSVIRALGSGATYNGPLYVGKGAALTATVTLAEGYSVASTGVTITMNNVELANAATVNGQIVTINIASVTGNVKISVPTINMSSPVLSWNITFTKSKTISDESGAVIDGSRGVSEIIPTDDSMKITVTSCNYIIYAYADVAAKLPLGYIANNLSAIETSLSSSLRWHTAGTTRTLEKLLNLNANIKAIRLMTYDNVNNPAYSVTSIIPDSSGESNATTPPVVATGWEVGTISGANGQPSVNDKRVRSTGYISVSGKTSVTVSNVDFIIACYDANNTYLGKYLNGVVNTTVEWNSAGTVVKISDILAANSNVAKFKLVGYAINANTPTII